MIGTGASVWSNVYFFFVLVTMWTLKVTGMLQRYISLLIGVPVANSISCLVYLLCFTIQMINQPWLHFPKMRDFKDFRYASISMVIMCLKMFPLIGCLLISSFIEIEI
jgi:hypothetical protein